MARRLDHFERAQKHVIEQAIKEIRSGKKTGHWIWYVFSQMKGLGKSGMSETYAIEDREHAYIYMNSPVLRINYRCCCQAILDSGKSAYEIFGDDAEQVRNSVLLMDSVWKDDIIKEVIKVNGWK